MRKLIENNEMRHREYHEKQEKRLTKQHDLVIKTQDQLVKASNAVVIKMKKLNEQDK